MLVSRFAYIDLNPPYQRDLVWKPKMKRKFILAILEGTATALIHLVEKSEQQKHFYWCMDAKQRISTIREFWENEFSVPFKCLDGVVREFYYKDLQQHNIGTARKFEDAQLKVEIYEPMPMATQKLVFEDINACVPLKYDEVLYGKNFILKAFLKTLFRGPFSQISGFAKGGIAEDRNRIGLRQIHIIFMEVFGLRFDESFAIKAYNQEQRTKSANDLERYLIEDCGLSFQSLTQNYTLTKETIEDIGWALKMKHFDNACRWLRDMITYNNAQEGMTKWDSGLVVDFMCCLMKLQQEKIINSAYVRANIKTFHEFVIAWMHHKRVSHKVDFSGKTEDKKTMEMRMTRMISIAEETGIDLSVKSRSISETDRMMAAISPGFRDPIDGRALRKDNMEFDHVEAKALGSESAVKVISNASNNLKGALNQKQAEEIAGYIKDNRKIAAKPVKSQ